MKEENELAAKGLMIIIVLLLGFFIGVIVMHFHYSKGSTKLPNWCADVNQVEDKTYPLTTHTIVCPTGIEFKDGM